MADTQYQVEIIINDKNVSLNSFVQAFYANTLIGSLQALRDAPTHVESLTVKIKKAE